MSERYDVVVVGGGVIGLACAWRASERGLRVCVLDAGDPGNASQAAAGMLAPASEVGESASGVAALSKASYAAYPAFVAALEEQSGLDVSFRICGVLQLALAEDERAELVQVHALQRGAGLETELLDAAGCHDREPGLAAGVVAGIWSAAEGQVDPQALVRALEAACLGRGVTVQRHARVERAELDGRRIVAVHTASDGFTADSFVLATGARSGEQAWLPAEVRPPVEPVKGQVVRGRLQAPPARALVRNRHVYVVSRPDGRVVVGASTEHAGFDASPSADVRERLLAAATRLLPALSELDYVEDAVGFRPGTPDGLPLIGATGLDNLLVATGHYRNGILLAPLTADAIARLLTGEPALVAT